MLGGKLTQVVSSKKTYTEAQKFCTKCGGNLYAPLTSEEYEAMTEDLVSPQKYFIGVDDINKEGT